MILLTFSLNQLTLRKKTIDNSVRYIAKSEQTKERESKPKTMKSGSLPGKQNKNISQNNKKFLETVAAAGFATLTK